jgi:hypothetical protein
MRTAIERIQKSEVWQIYRTAPREQLQWEHPEGSTGLRGSGLLLSICPHCGAEQTPETYVQGFAEKISLHISYDCYGIQRCMTCNGWSIWHH